MARTIRVVAEVQIPTVPNFLIYDGGKLSVADVPKEDLKKIGEVWTESLIENAETIRQRRAQP